MTMNVTCSDRERIFEDGTPAEWAALEAHATSCPLCAQEVRGWKSLSVAAKQLRDYSDSPSFWPRIERALAEQAGRKAQSTGLRRWLLFFPSLSIRWQTALAVTFVLILTMSAGWVYFQRDRKSTRLNSSHDQISYAVFCLKKKIIQSLGGG